MVNIGGPEIFFAKKLANNNPKVRRRALKKLKVWLFNRSKIENGLSEDDLLKIWKGLFYCMWFSDSYLVQEALANDLANIIHLFKNQEIGLSFSKTFFDEIGREWLGIDRLRLDKFYLLIKNVLRETLKYIGLGGWDSNSVSLFVSNLQKDLSSSTYPVGLKIFLSEKIIDQLSGVIENEKELNFPKSNQILDLLQPFFNYFIKCECESVGITIEEEILNPLCSLKLAKQKNDGKIKRLALPYNAISQCLFTVASNKDVSTKHRKKLFLFAEEFKNCNSKAETKKSKKRKLKQESGKNDKDIGKKAGKIKKKSNSKKTKVQAKGGDSNLNIEIKENNLEDHDKSIDFQIDSNDEQPSECENSDVSVTKTILDKSSTKSTITDNAAQPSIEVEKGERAMTKSTQKLLKNIGGDKQKDEEINVEKQKALKLDGEDSGKKISNGTEAPMEFLKLTPTASFFKKAKGKALSENKVRVKPCKKTISKSERRPRVKIELSKNKSISHKDLKLSIASSPLPPFSPTKKPVKSALKTPSKYSSHN